MRSALLISTCKGASAAFLLLALTGCISDKTLPTAADDSATAIVLAMTGKLRLQGDCVRLDRGDRSYLVIWSHGARVDYSTRPPLVLDGRGGSARIGDSVALEGGPRNLPLPPMSRKTAEILRHCGGPVFRAYGFT